MVSLFHNYLVASVAPTALPALKARVVRTADNPSTGPVTRALLSGRNRHL